MINRQKRIKEKGFDIQMNGGSQNIDPGMADFAKIKLGAKTLEDATLLVDSPRRRGCPKVADKDFIIRAIKDGNVPAMIEISEYFYKTSGVYSRLCRYMAYLYRYDWMITPHILDKDKVKEEKVIEGFQKALTYLDNFGAKKFFGETALKVIKHGCYYGYCIDQGNKMVVQELPPQYCRCRAYQNGSPVVEFHMSFFDEFYPNPAERIKVLNLFPKDFRKGYALYKEGKLSCGTGEEIIHDKHRSCYGWYMLDPGCAIKFSLNEDDFPLFISAIPAIIDLDDAQELDKKRMAQQLLKIIIQKMPIDKNGDLVFDVDEAQQLHNNAVRMLSRAVGIDVLTTFADVEVASMQGTYNTSATDDLEKVERRVFNETGSSEMLFNTDGNIALDKSILNDEAALYNLIQQFEEFLNRMLTPFNKNPKKLHYRVQILPTTIYNYKEVSKLYKEQTQLGYSKMLPQIALGQSQSNILHTAYFENSVLMLVREFIPPLNTNVLNAEVINGLMGKEVLSEQNATAPSSNKDSGNSKDSQSGGEGAGRPTKESQGESVSEKTMQNRESAH